MILFFVVKLLRSNWEISPAEESALTLIGRRIQRGATDNSFSDWKLRRRAPDNDVATFQTKCNELRLLAARTETENPLGALVLFQFTSLALLFLIVCAPFLVYCFDLQYTLTQVERTTLCTIMVCAALCLFGGLVVPLMCCPAGLVGSFCVWASVGLSRCLPGSVALLAVLEWALLVLLLFALFCFWLLSLSLLLSLPPRVVLFGVLVQLVPRFCWYLPLGVWLQL